MSEPTCHAPLSWETLLAYRLGELAPDQEAQTEEHYLGCALCTQRFEQLTMLAQGIRALARGSGVATVVNDQFIHRLREEGRQVREYRVPLNGAVNCTVTPDDDFVVAHLEAPLNTVTRLDLLHILPDGNIALRQEDIPFLAESDGVVVVTNIDQLRAFPAITLCMRLLAVDNNGERTLGDYQFNHTPYSSD